MELDNQNLPEKDLFATFDQIKDQLIHAEKTRLLGQLTGGIAHEMNNPLSFVMSNVGLLHKYFAQISILLESYNQLMDELNKNPSYKKTRLYHKIISLNENNNIFSKLADFDDMLLESKEGLDRIQLFGHRPGNASPGSVKGEQLPLDNPPLLLCPRQAAGNKFKIELYLIFRGCPLVSQNMARYFKMIFGEAYIFIVLDNCSIFEVLGYIRRSGVATVP